MGKSKDEHKRKRSSPSSPRAGEEGRRKGEEEVENRKFKKKHKSHKSSKHRSDKEKKSGEKRKDKGRRIHDKSLKPDFQELSNDDYFSKNNEFALWLKEERNIFFSDLSSDAARNLFAEFVKEWNSQELEPQYYEGIATGPRTTYKWNIKK